MEIALLLVSVFKYIAEHFHKKVNATMYLLGYQAMIYVGSVVVAPPAGYLYAKIGFEQTYLMMGCCALFFTLVSGFTLSRCRSDSDPHPEDAQTLDAVSIAPAKSH
jgi:OHS family lactose permease-like MFS transporter